MAQFNMFSLQSLFVRCFLLILIQGFSDVDATHGSDLNVLLVAEPEQDAAVKPSMLTRHDKV